MARPTKALIDAQALRHNLQLAQTLSANGRCVAIIKANAYGHGATLVAKALANDAEVFGVACIEEALALRNSGIAQPILLLEGAFSSDEILIASQQNFWLMACNTEQVDAILHATLAVKVTVWLKVDTGMHRLGVAMKDMKDCYLQLKNSANVVDNPVIASHLSSADDFDNDQTTIQTERLTALAAEVNAPISLANTPALLGWPQTRGDWNRPGFMLYGNSPFTVANDQAAKLKPVMSLLSRVIDMHRIPAGDSVGYGQAWTAQRESLIATIAVGYGDGYPRACGNGTPVWIKGSRAPLVGRVSMDMITVDVTDIADVVIGDEVELWGGNITATEIAEHASTIGYEVLTRMPARTPRYLINT